MSSEPSEITSLLPRSGRSTPRKGSTRGTSTGTQATSHHPPPRPIPIRQTPYSTWPIRLSFLLITLLSFVSVGVLVILALNTRFATLLSPYLPRHRSSRVLPMWYGLIASWLSVSTVILFWIPSKSTRISLLASLILLTTDLFLICLVPELLHRESLLTISICIFAILTIGACILSNRIVQAAQDKEASIVHHGSESVREAELRARVLLLQEENNFWKYQIWKVIKKVLSFTAVFVTSVVLFLITIDLLIRSYDSTYPLPFKFSRLYTVKSGASVKYKVHLACTGPTSMKPPELSIKSDENMADLTNARGGSRAKKIPTVLLETDTGVAGTRGGDWLLKMRERGEIGRVCIWDRPGYGFSDASESTEVGATVNALWEALGQSKEKGPFVLVGAGYGGILTRVFASRHPDMVYGHLFIDAYTARTYFLTGHRRSPLMHKHLPSLFSPLSLHRFPQALFGGRHSTSRLDRILGSTQNPLTLATLAQESTLSHSRSASFNTLVKSLETYPSDASTIILSSGNRTRDDKIWEKSQRDLWEDVTDEKGRLRWTVVDDVGHAICDDSRGREECEAAVSELVWH